MRLRIPTKVALILDNLVFHGYEAYAVGGCVRDSILARTPDDWDITTSAKPEEVKQLFERTVDTGLQHGTVTVLLGGEGFEVTTYRIDGEYEDHRHPTEVAFASDLREDLRRRDFTINAMAYNRREGLVDMFGGMQDLQKKVIRCVGDPMERFTEDALRILRAVRFSAQLGFYIDPPTQEAIGALAGNLKHISAERIQAELVKLLISPHPEYIYAAQEMGILDVILPELGELSEETLMNLKRVPARKDFRLAVLFQRLGEENTVRILRRLKFDNDTIIKVRNLIRWYDYEITGTQEGVRRCIHLMGEETFPDVVQMQQIYRPMEEILALYDVILREHHCVSLKDLELTGSDLIALGMRPGKEIGEVLHQLLDKVLEDPKRNNRAYLLTMAKRKLE